MFSVGKLPIVDLISSINVGLFRLSMGSAVASPISFLKLATYVLSLSP
jgi:hypothetical protein